MFKLKNYDRNENIIAFYEKACYVYDRRSGITDRFWGEWSMKNSRVNIESRRNAILKMLQMRRKISVDDLAEGLNVTTATIRRDLSRMEEEGTVRRGFGTAEFVQPDNMREIEPTDVEDEKAFVRRRIARRAASMIEDGDVIFMNSSGTASLVLEYVGSKNVTVLTNNARIIERRYGSNVSIILTGGEVYGKKQSLVGQFALDSIKRVSATKCILGVSGISATGGLTSRILAETQINMSMLQNCHGEKIVVTESSKVGITQNFYSGSLREIDYLITDDGADHMMINELQLSGLKVQTV